MKGTWSNCALFSTKSVHWSTPKNIYDYYIGLRYYDPCPLNASFDALTIEWHKKNFVNPPYDNIFAFVKKAVDEEEKGNETVLLVPARTDTKWFHYILENTVCEIEFVKGRLKFGGKKFYAPFPSILITIYGKSIKS